MTGQSLRDYLALLAGRGELRVVEEQVDPRYEVSAHLALNGAGPALRFDRVAGSGMRVVGNVLCSRERIALGLKTSLARLQGAIVAAIEAPLGAVLENATVTPLGADLIVDALYGTGLTRPLTGLAETIEYVATTAVIVFFSALMSVLYYLGVMQKVVAILGGAVRRLLGTSQTESMSAVSNTPPASRLRRSLPATAVTINAPPITGRIRASFATDSIAKSMRPRRRRSGRSSPSAISSYRRARCPRTHCVASRRTCSACLL